MLTIRIALSPESLAALERRAAARAAFVPTVNTALAQGLDETAGYLKSDLLRGGAADQKRSGGTPLAVRTGRLLGSIVAGLDGNLSGYVGSAGNKYAKVLLDKDTWIMRPANAKHLWIPVGQNRRPDGLARMSPREAMQVRGPRGGHALKIFTSKSGNLVAVMMGDVVKDSAGESMGLVRGATAFKTGTRLKSGKNKGQLRSRLLFVLKESVEVQGTDALAKAVEAKTDRITELVGDAARKATSGD